MPNVAGMWTEFFETTSNQLWLRFSSDLPNFGSVRCILRCIIDCRTPDFCPTEAT